MTLENNFNQIVWIWIAFSIPVFIVLQFVVAPFGRHSAKGFGPAINNKFAWVVMESVSFVTVAYLFMTGSGTKTPASWYFYGWGTTLTGRLSMHYGKKIQTRRCRLSSFYLPLYLTV